ncbi:imelysin family protein [Maribacter sp.]|uniref:imelysin family protein n=1 Tax=Maribacter sp. TaxID=1897614 RepID=UPI0025BCCD6B|nr:imelysin family protein [Maribacter sp.]
MKVNNTKNIFYIFFACFICITIFIACEQEGNSEFTSEVQLYKNAQLSNIYDNEIYPLTIEFTTETNVLVSLAKTYKGQPTAANLETLQLQWKSIQLIWKQLELYDLGDIANSFITFEINRWPTNPENIEEIIASDDVINADYIATKGSSSKGISGLEYLIFSNKNTAKTRRLDYIVAVSKNLELKANQLASIWADYAPSFTTALNNGIDGSQNQVINAMVTLIEEIIISKLGNALGDTNGGTIEVNRLEAYRSSFSKEIIATHLSALKKCYSGEFAQTPFRVGFDDFLTLIGSEAFSEKINTQFKDCENKLNAIPSSLKEEIENNPENVIALKDAMRELLILIKVDMANILGSTITFNDNDGD